MPMYVTHQRGGLALGTLVSHGGCQQEGFQVWGRGMCEAQLTPAPPSSPQGHPRGGGAPSREWGNTAIGEDVANICLLPTSAPGPDPAVCRAAELQLLPTGNPATDTQRTFQPVAEKPVGEELAGCGDPPAGAGRAVCQFGRQVLRRCQTLLPAWLRHERILCPWALGQVKPQLREGDPGSALSSTCFSGGTQNLHCHGNVPT